jgi:hypothetical protein
MEAKTDLTFEQWIEALEAYHARLRETEDGFQGYGRSVVAATGAECWRSYFEDGYMPEDALDTDRSYWD